MNLRTIRNRRVGREATPYECDNCLQYDKECRLLPCFFYLCRNCTVTYYREEEIIGAMRQLARFMFWASLEARSQFEAVMFNLELWDTRPANFVEAIENGKLRLSWGR